MFRKILFFSLMALSTICKAQTFNFTFDGRDRKATLLTPETVYTKERGYGFDFTTLTAGTKAQFVSVAVPDGNYLVTITLGSKKQTANTTVRAESRRLFLENIATKKGEFKTYMFVVNKRDTQIRDEAGKVIDRVRIKKREEGKLNWDEKLTLEFNGNAPAVSSVKIEPANTDIPTIYLCGNSTVVDQDYEPWASWGQMIPRWFDERVAFANYAESGETARTFISAGRLKKILSLLKRGDFVLVEFGHNDQKERFAGAGAWYHFSVNLKLFEEEVRNKEATIIFVTPTQRRSFRDGRIQETHGDFPDAMRAVAKHENIPVIELHDMTRTFYETLGEEASTRAFVHYPANTFPNQPKALADNTHFNPYGAYEIAKMVIEGMKQIQMPILQYLRSDYTPFNPAHPDSFDSVHWMPSPFYEMVKPDGN